MRRRSYLAATATALGATLTAGCARFGEGGEEEGGSDGEGGEEGGGEGGEEGGGECRGEGDG